MQRSIVFYCSNVSVAEDVWEKKMVNVYPPADEAHTLLKVILVAFHDEQSYTPLIQMLTHQGSYLIIFVNTATQVLEFTRDIIPNLLLLDYKLQKEHGFQLMQQLHVKALQDVPIIVYNAPVMQHEWLQGMYLMKTCQIEELTETIHSLAA